MIYPSLVYYQTIAEYRSHYKRVYCQKPIKTFDEIAVRFRNDIFDHCFFESTQRNQVKDVFSNTRAERMDWIKAALQDSAAKLYVGWDGKRKRYDKNRRVVLVVANYIGVQYKKVTQSNLPMTNPR